MIGVLTSGFNPSPNALTAITEVLLMSPMRLVAIIYRYTYNQIVNQVHAKKKKAI